MALGFKMIPSSKQIPMFRNFLQMYQLHRFQTTSFISNISMDGQKSLEKEDRDASHQEEEENGVVSFYVNKDGLPMSSKTWERMWSHVEKIQPDKIQRFNQIRGNPNLDKVPVAVPPVLTISMTVKEKLKAIQDYLKQLQYNHTGTQLFEIRKNRPLSGLMDTAREIIRESLPIKCLEAVIASLYLLHIVLGVVANSKYGALGLSRREDLMYKPLGFKSLFDLINDFIISYSRYDHSVKKIKLSLPIVRDLHSCERIYWKYITFSPNKLGQPDMKKLLDKYSREIKLAANTYYATSPRKQLDNLSTSS